MLGLYSLLQNFNYYGKAFFASDFHLDVDEDERIKKFIKFIHFVSEKNNHLYILGDLFNFWAGNAQSFLSYARPLIKALRYFSDNITFLNGNRDFLFSYYWEKYKGNVIRDGKIIIQDTKKIMLYHGDALCTGDINYQKMKIWLQSPYVYYVSKLLAPTMCLKIGRKMRNVSKQAIKKKSKNEMGLNYNYIKDLLESKTANTVICGHIHKKEITPFKTTKEIKYLYVLPENTGDKIHYLSLDKDIFTFCEF